MKNFFNNGFIFLLNLLSCVGMGQNNFDKKVNSLLSGTVPVVSQEELTTMLMDGEDVVLLDTRSVEEYNVSKIPGAEFIDYDHFSMDMVEHIPKEEQIIVYCSVGYRSEKIGEKLKQSGYTNVHNLYGGIFDWKNNDQQVVNIENQPTDSVHTYNKSWSKWLIKGIKIYD